VCQGKRLVRFGQNYPTFPTGVAVMDRLTLPEAFVAALLGTTCLLARSPLQATHGSLVPLERLRRSRWQWFSMAVLMLLLRVQHVLPEKVELAVGLQFLVFLAVPIRGLVRRTGIGMPSASEQAFAAECDPQSAHVCSPTAVEA
jgi:hypothetical protein